MPAEIRSSPFGFFATPLNPVSPGPGGINAMSPLPDFIPALPAAAEFALPLGTIKSPADRSVPSSLPPEKLACDSPDFPSLPVGLLLFGNQPSDQRSRSATFHPAQLFREPLGTKAIMRWNKI
ncbi:MAG TPA: hypothetical protein VNH83_03995 [Bryobacteraceae bacterium]|jgi:hypothetical protein|nr:hypothetical protein [Bryobacteraceae bacterium]